MFLYDAKPQTQVTLKNYLLSQKAYGFPSGTNFASLRPRFKIYFTKLIFIKAKEELIASEASEHSKHFLFSLDVELIQQL